MHQEIFVLKMQGKQQIKKKRMKEIKNTKTKKFRRKLQVEKIEDFQEKFPKLNSLEEPEAKVVAKDMENMILDVSGAVSKCANIVITSPNLRQEHCRIDTNPCKKPVKVICRLF